MDKMLPSFLREKDNWEQDGGKQTSGGEDGGSGPLMQTVFRQSTWEG